ncbi:hypothetical protein B0H13DRAFT_2293443 [Mycena leptocephala]|nr:hypothetical protein B0H13DRAFT_2293443 [Mycena leptocephala]
MEALHLILVPITFLQFATSTSLHLGPRTRANPETTKSYTRASEIAQSLSVCEPGVGMGAEPKPQEVDEERAYPTTIWAREFSSSVVAMARTNRAVFATAARSCFAQAAAQECETTQEEPAQPSSSAAAAIKLTEGPKPQLN